MMRDGYEIDPFGKRQHVGDLDTLRELARAGVVHAGTPIRDERTQKVFAAGDHPYLRSVVRPAPVQLAPPPTHGVSRRRSRLPLIIVVVGATAAVVALGIVLLPRFVAGLSGAIGRPLPPPRRALCLRGTLGQSEADLKAFQAAAPIRIIGGGERMGEFASKGDSYTLGRLEQERRIIPLPGLVNLTVLSQDGPFCYVRVADPGVNEGLTGYVLTSHLYLPDGQATPTPFDPSFSSPVPGL